MSLFLDINNLFIYLSYYLAEYKLEMRTCFTNKKTRTRS